MSLQSLIKPNSTLGAHTPIFLNIFFKGPLNHGVPKVYRRRVKPFYKEKLDLKPYNYTLTRGKPVKTIEQE